MPYRNVLVTGGTGFIGSHLVERLLKEERNVVRVLALRNSKTLIEHENCNLLREKGAEIVYGDLRDIDSLYDAVKHIDCVFHLGAISRPMKILKKEYYDNSVLGTENILKVSRTHGVRKFIHTSTVSVLGVSPNGLPLEENDYQGDEDDYPWSKRLAENLALEYYNKHNLPVVIIRPSLVYGPRCLVRLIMFRFIKYGIFPLFNQGIVKIEFAHVDNIVEAILLAEINEAAIGEIFNITDGQSYEIREVLNCIADELKVIRPFMRLPCILGRTIGIMSEVISRAVGVYPPFSRTAVEWMSSNRNVYSCEKAKKILGYSPIIDLKEGVKKTVEYYKGIGKL